jgi:chromosome segregation protein
VKQVVWERLLLEGFGRHRRLEACFAPGLITWIGPNESGKSTAVIGLLATVWGLPHVQDVRGLTWPRFRSWHGGPHRGEVTLRAGDGERYTITREFERHQVRVVRHAASGDEIVVDGVHNPNARKETSTFEPWLESSIGLRDLNLVLETFVVAQEEHGGDPHRLDQEVQALVSGAGGGTYRAALESLADEMRARTRWLRRLDLGLADLRNDRQLEQLEAEIEERRAALERGRAAADGLQAAQLALASAEAEHHFARTDAERLRDAVTAQRSWVDRRDATLREAARVRDVRRSLERARELAAAVRGAEEALAETWPAFEGAPPDTGRQLDAFAATRRGSAIARERVAEAERALAARRREAEEALATPATIEELVRGDGRDWGRLGRPAADVLARARRATVTLLRQVYALRGARERLATLLDEYEPLDVFGALDDDTRNLLDDYGSRGRALAEALAAARARRDELLERMRRHEAAFAEVRQLDEEQVAALRAFDQAWETRRDPWPWRLALALVGGVGGYFGVPALVELFGTSAPGWSAYLGAGVLGLVGGALAPRGDATRAAKAGLAALGVHGDDEELRQRLRQREAFEAQRDQVDHDALALEAAEAETAAAEAEGAAFRDAVAPFLAALPPGTDIGEAYARWKLLAPQVERERAVVAAHAADVADADADGLEATPVARAGESAAEIARLAVLQGAIDADFDTAPETVTIAALVDWLERVADTSWELWREAAAAHDQARAASEDRAREHDSARTLWEQRVADAEVALARAVSEQRAAERAESEAVQALAWLWPRLATSTVAAPAPSRAGAGASAGVEIGFAVDRGDPGGSASTSEHDVLIDDDEVPDTQLRGLMLDAHDVAAAPLDPHLLQAGWAERRRAEDALAGCRRELEVHLAASGATELDHLERSLENATLRAGAALSAWQELVRHHPDLPRADPDGGAVDASFRTTQEAAEAATRREREAHEAVLAASRRLASLQGAEVLNVAVTEAWIDEALRGAARLRRELEAEALAYRELTAAVDGFRAEHRDRLEQRAGEHLAAFSSVPGRLVLLGDDFEARVREPDGEIAVPSQLSQGARDQLALALRLAVADLLSGEVALPLVFDDPFLNWDEARLARLREVLVRLAAERQVIVLSHRAALGAWGAAVERTPEA